MAKKVDDSFPPKKITIKSDLNVLTFKEMLKPFGSKEVYYTYQYTKSIYKKDQLLGLTEPELRKLIATNA